MPRLLASNLPERSPGYRPRAAEWNALVRAHKVATQLSGGYSGPSYSANASKIKTSSEWVEFTTTTTVPAYSIFSLTADESWRDPVRFVAKQIGITSHGSHAMMFTNGQTAIPSGSIGLARPINAFAPSRIAYTSPAPVVGRPCGPALDTWTIDGERFGLVCLAVDSGESRAEIIRTPEIIGALAEVTTRITAFNTGTKTLGAGAAKLLARTAATDILASILDPGVESTPPAWILPVYSTRVTPVEVGEIVEVTSMLGVGLVISKGEEGLQKFQIVGNHPGIDIVFDVYLGTWDPATNDYIYDCDTTFKGIDHYFGVPYPSDYPTGHGLWKPSDTHTEIIDVVAMDCEGRGIDCPA